MADKNIAPFKIGDKQLTPVAPGAKKGHDTAHAVDPKDSEEASLGFRRIEGILESEDLTAIQQRLGNLYDAVMAFQNNSKANKDKSAATKVITAIERTNELMVYLFQTKQALITQAMGSGESKGNR